MGKPDDTHGANFEDGRHFGKALRAFRYGHTKRGLPPSALSGHLQAKVLLEALNSNQKLPRISVSSYSEYEHGALPNANDILSFIGRIAGVLTLNTGEIALLIKAVVRDRTARDIGSLALSELKTTPGQLDAEIADVAQGKRLPEVEDPLYRKGLEELRGRYMADTPRASSALDAQGTS